MYRYALVLAILVATPSLSHDELCEIEEVDIRALVASYADRNEAQFVLDPRVRSKVSIPGLDIETMDFLTLVGIFNMHGFVAIESNDVVYVIPDRVAQRLRDDLSETDLTNSLGDNAVPVNFELEVFFDVAANEVKLQCSEGCPWEYLSFSCENRAECKATVNGWGTPAE